MHYSIAAAQQFKYKKKQRKLNINLAHQRCTNVSIHDILAPERNKPLHINPVAASNVKKYTCM
jgi:hypothetical protein